jgi:hypothetical protein
MSRRLALLDKAADELEQLKVDFHGNGGGSEMRRGLDVHPGLNPRRPVGRRRRAERR